MTDKEQLIEVIDDLRLIERTRLLCNTRTELERMVGFTISGNGLARMGGKSLFMKDAVFRELAHIARTQADLDLKTVIDTYQESNKIMASISRKVATDDFFLHLIDHYFGEGHEYGDISSVTQKAELRHVPILLLMLMGILPRTKAKGGDVKDINGDYKRLFALLRKAVNQHIPMQILPALIAMEDEVRRQPSLMNRFHLIYTTTYILSAYGRISTREGVMEANDNLTKMQTFPDIEGIWTEGTSSTMFWQFKRITNGFRLFHYTLNNEKRQLTYTEYFIKFFQDEEETLALVVHPKAIRYTINNTPTPNRYFAYLRWRFHDDELTFSPVSTDDKWFPLSKLKRNNLRLFEQVVDNERYEKLNLFQSEAYIFNDDLAAITEDDIYIHDGEGTYYKISKSLNPLLESVHFGMTIGVMKFEDATYIAFDDLSLFFDISDVKKREKNGISVVREIKPQP